jgi:hypothetical protein
MRYLWTVLLLATVCFAQEITVPENVLKQYVGVYQLAPKFNIMISLENGQLMTQASGQGKAPIYASSETKYFLKVTDAQIDFVKDDKGKVTSLTLHQGGQDIPAQRISDTLPPPKKEITVSPKILAQYTGTYELRPGFDLVVTLEGDHLITQATGQSQLPIFAESETKFFPKVMDASIEFFKDEKGAATHLILIQGPAEIKAPRK